jgi:tetratricopeptide (TPR) repeat protein
MKGGAADAGSPPGQPVDVVRLSALAHSAYAEKKIDVVLELSSRLLEADPENAVGLKLTARILTQRGDIDLAEPIWRRLFATGPDKIEPALSLARIGYARSDWDAMAEFADLAVRESGERADALRLAITARIKANRADELPEMLIRFHDAAPDQFIALLKTLSSPELAQAQASVLVRLGARAVRDPTFDSLARDCRKFWEVAAKRARSRKDDEVRASYLRAIWRFDPSSGEVVDELNSLSRERLKFLRMAIKRGDGAVALQQAEAVAKFNPASFEAWFAIARLSATNDPQRSADCFRTCAEIKPADVYYRFQEGLALIKAERPTEAILAFRTAVKDADDPSDPIAIAAGAEIAGLRPAVFNHAVEAARVGRLEEAQTAYSAARGFLNQSGGGFPTAAHALFWAFMLAAHIRTTLRSLSLGAVTAWKQTRSGSARLRRRFFTRAAISTARPKAARSTRR